MWKELSSDRSFKLFKWQVIELTQKSRTSEFYFSDLNEIWIAFYSVKNVLIPAHFNIFCLYFHTNKTFLHQSRSAGIFQHNDRSSTLKNLKLSGRNTQLDMYRKTHIVLSSKISSMIRIKEVLFPGKLILSGMVFGVFSPFSYTMC